MLTPKERTAKAQERKKTHKCKCGKPAHILRLTNGYGGISRFYAGCTDERFLEVLENTIPLCRACHKKMVDAEGLA